MLPDNVTTIGKQAFDRSINTEVTLPDSITSIGQNAFGSNNLSYCKKVLVKNDTIKQKVIASGYPENKIENY